MVKQTPLKASKLKPKEGNRRKSKLLVVLNDCYLDEDAKACNGDEASPTKTRSPIRTRLRTGHLKTIPQTPGTVKKPRNRKSVAPRIIDIGSVDVDNQPKYGDKDENGNPESDSHRQPMTENHMLSGDPVVLANHDDAVRGYNCVLL